MTYTSRHPARILHHPGSIRRGMNIAITGLQELTAYLQAKPTIQAKPAKENLVRMINQMIPAALEKQDLKFQERYLSVTERPHYTESLRVCGEETTCLFAARVPERVRVDKSCGGGDGDDVGVYPCRGRSRQADRLQSARCRNRDHAIRGTPDEYS